MSSDENVVYSMANISITASTFDYIRRLMDLGAIEGGILNEKRPSEELLPLFNAMHHILGGGKVQIKIEQEGNSEIINNLRNLLERSILDSNMCAKNEKYVVALQG